MATKPLRPCQHPGCPRLTSGTRCHVHAIAQVRRYQNSRPSSAARGYDRDWQRIRADVIAEHPVCQRCNVKPARDVHHVRALRQGGTHDRSNLVALCRGCHLSIERQAVTR